MQKIRNPFVAGLTVPYVQNITNYKIINPLDSEKYGYEVESAEYVRTYTNKNLREFIFTKLSMYARDMLSAIQYFTNPGYEYTIITYEKMQELYGPDYKLVKRRFDDTLRELIKMSVVDVKDRAKGQYWYNPQFFCAGNRLKMYEQCKLKIATKTTSPQRLND